MKLNNMKKLILVVCLLVSAVAFGQRPTNYTKLFHRYNYVSMKADSALMVPVYGGTPVGVRVGETIRDGYIAIDSVNSVFYFYSDSAWRTVTGVNIYNSNGTLTSNRTLTGDANSLTFTGLSSFLTAIGSTTRLSLNSTSSVMQSPDGQNYVEATDTSMNINTQNNYLQITDTELRLDTLTRDPGIWDLRWDPTTKKITYSDTAALGGKLNISDTTNMLANYLITASDLSPLFTTSESGHNITFNGSNTTQYTVLGRTASGSGAYSFVSIDTTFISDFYTKVRSLFSAGTGITITNGQIASTVTGGTVTSVTATDANGFDFTITDPTTAPNISLTTSVTNTRVIYSNSGAVAGIAGVTSDGTNMTAGSENLRATSPRIVTGINDTNGNEFLLLTATGSAVNELTLANAATGSNPSLTASGSDSNIGFDYISKGTGSFNLVGNSTQAAQIRLYEDTDNGTNYTAFQVGTQAGNLTYTLPTAYPGVSGYALTSTDAGVMSWAAMGTVTSFAYTDGNGLDGTVTNSTTTPTLSITSTVTNTQLMYSNSGAFAGVSGVTSDGTNITAGSANLRATRPRITTSVDDASGNEIFIFTATGSAVNEFTVANAATGGNPTFTASGSDSNIGIDLQSKGTGTVNVLGNSTQSGELRIYEDTDGGAAYTAFRVPSLSASITYTLPSDDGDANQVLSTNGSGDLDWIAVPVTASNGLSASSGNVTLGGSALSGNSSILTSAYYLDITSSNTTQTLKSINSSSGIGVFGTSSSGVGVQGNSTSGVGVQGYSDGTYAGQFSTSTATTNTNETVLNVVRFTSGTAANNISGSIDINVQTVTAAGSYLSNKLISRWTDATHATRTSSFIIDGFNSGTQRQLVSFAGSGTTTFGVSGTNKGSIALAGNTSGAVTISPAAAAGTWTLELPANDGDADQVLKTNGSGVTSWAAVPRYTPLVVSSASETSLTINADITDIYVLTAQTDNITFNSPTGTLVQGQKLIIRVKDDDLGPYTITWNAVFRDGDTALPTTFGGGKTVYLGFIYNSTDSKWDLVAKLEGVS